MIVQFNCCKTVHAFSLSVPFFATFSLFSKSFGLRLSLNSLRPHEWLRNGCLGTWNRNFHRKEKVMQVLKENDSLNAHLHWAIGKRYTKRKEQIETFLPFSSKKNTPQGESEEPGDPSGELRRSYSSKAHTFAWIFPGYSELPFCGPGATGLKNQLLVPVPWRWLFFGTSEEKEVLTYKVAP